MGRGNAVTPPGIRGGRPAGRGLLWTVVTLLVQLLVVVSGWGRVHEAPPSPPRTLAVAVVVQPPFGGEPGQLDGRQTWPVGSQVQLTFGVDSDGWTSVLWFSGEGVVSLYPSPGQTGQTGEHSYAVPGPEQWLRLTPTPNEGDFLVLIHGPVADPRVTSTLGAPRPDAVRRLRAALEQEASSWSVTPSGVQRYLPTADGRAIPVRWERIASSHLMVRGWTIKTGG